MPFLLFIIVLVISCSEYERGSVLDSKSDQYIQIELLDTLTDTKIINPFERSVLNAIENFKSSNNMFIIWAAERDFFR